MGNHSSPAEPNEPQTDYFGQAACEAAKVVGVLAGFGCLPLLWERFPKYPWIGGLTTGTLALAVGLFHATRLWSGLSKKPVPTRLAGLSLPIQTILIGMCLLLESLVAFGVRRQAGLEAGLLLIYLSNPAILVWISGEALFARPLFYIRPLRIAEVVGLLGRGLQILGALLMWIFLGLSVGTGSISWMLWAAAGLAGIGLLLALSTGTSVAAALMTLAETSQ